MTGKIRIGWQLPSGEVVYWKFTEQPTTQRLEELEAQYVVAHEYDSVGQATLTLTEHQDLLKECVLMIKDNPSLTLNQYNNYLATKAWYEESIIRFFVYKLAQELSQRAELSLDNSTQAEVLLKLRNWVVDTPVKKIAKVVLGNQEGI